MLICPFCQTDLSDDANEAGRCFSCGSLVMWQDERREREDVGRPDLPDNERPPAELPLADDSPTSSGSPWGDITDSTPIPLSPEIAAKFGQATIDFKALGASDPTLGGAQPSPLADSGSFRILPSSLTEAQSASPSKQLSSAQAENLQTLWHSSLRDSATPSTSLKADMPILSELSSAQAEQMRTLWKGTLSGVHVSPRTSLKTKETTRGPRQSTLVIGARALRDVAEPNDRDADYELLDRLGEGGMGVVYAARQASMDRVVAVKMLHKDIANVAEQRDKFLSEAVVTAELDHPNIVPIHDLGKNDVGDLFYSMKRVQGTPWCDVIGEKKLEENLEILLKVCDAVAFAHTRGVVHRDLKPENTMLGDFGEVLVMDWGLAMATQEFRRANSITQSCSMGGTPAYMAPEMAKGPYEAIGTASDIYLLGAILFEIITGKTPHTGNDTMACLFAAARNEIQPTTESGELLDIALAAMASEPGKRFATVKDLQDAIRDYQSHVESIVLSDRADRELDSASTSDDYQEYAAALYGYKEALALWPGNERAAAGVKRAALDYATSALRKEDYDLAASLLDSDDPNHGELAKAIEVAQKERASRARRLRNLRSLSIGLLVIVFVTVGVAFMWIRKDRNLARSSAAFAIQQKQAAEVARQQADQNAEEARAAEQTALDKEQQAKKAEADAMRSAAEAKEARAAEEYEAYRAQIQLIAEKIEQNAFREARQLLELQSDSQYRHWEWGRLDYLCQDFGKRFATAGRVDAVRFDRDGTQFGAACRDGVVRIWSTGDESTALDLQHANLYVHDLVFFPDRPWVATASSDGKIRVFDTATGQFQGEYQAHNDSALCVAITPDGKTLLTGSYDHSLRVWDVTNLDKVTRLQDLHAHSWWVWDVDVSSDGRTVVSASQDGKVVVWSVVNDGQQNQLKQTTEFTGHVGPVFAASIAPDNLHVVSGGQDHRVLIWSWQEVEPVDVAARVRGVVSAPPPFRALDGHRGAIRSVAFSPDGTRIISGSADNSIRVWDSTTGELHKTLRGHEREVRSCVFSPSGRDVLSGGHDDVVRLWNVGDYREVRLLGTESLVGHSDAVMSAAYSDSGKQIVTASRDRSAVVWNAETGQAERVLKEGHEYLASLATFVADGSQLLTGGGDDTVRIWDIGTGTELGKLEGVGRNGVLVASPDGKHALTGNGENVLEWHLTDRTTSRSFGPHRSNVSAIACAANGQWLLSADTIGNCYLWERATGRLVWQKKTHMAMVTAAHFLPGDDLIVTASGDNTVAVSAVDDGRELPDRSMPHPDWVTTLSMSGDGETGVSACHDGVVRVWDMATDKVRGTLMVPVDAQVVRNNIRRLLRTKKWHPDDLAQRSGVDADEIVDLLAGKRELQRDSLERLAQAFSVSVTAIEQPMVSAVSVSGDGRYALTVMAEQHQCRLWDLKTLKEISPPGSTERDGGAFVQLPASAEMLWAGAFSPDNIHFATVGGNRIRLWSTQESHEQMNFSPHGTIAEASISPTGDRVITAGWDNSAKIWQVSDGRAVRKLTGQHTGHINSAVFSHDSSRAVTASDDGTCVVWDAETGEPTGVVLRGHAGAIVSVRFSPDGTKLLTASLDRTARIWNSETGELVQVLVDDQARLDGAASASHKLAVQCAEFFQRQGRLWAITGGEDGTAKIWDVSTGSVDQRLNGHIGPVTSVAASPDGLRVITGSRDTTVRLWDPIKGTEVLTLKGHSQEITAARFSPNGRDILTSSRDGLGLIWPSNPWQGQPRVAADGQLLGDGEI